MIDRPPRIRTFTLLNFPKGTLFNRVNFRYTTAAFTLSPEPWALLCCLPVRCTQTGRLIALHSGFLHLPVGRQGHHLAMMPLPSASTFITIIK